MKNKMFVSVLSSIWTYDEICTVVRNAGNDVQDKQLYPHCYRIDSFIKSLAVFIHKCRPAALISSPVLLLKLYFVFLVKYYDTLTIDA